MGHVSEDSALHHRRAIVILDITLPASLRHVDSGATILTLTSLCLCKALLLEILNGVVVSVSQEVVKLVFLGVVLQAVHQSSTIALHLFRSSNGEEHNLSKLLLVKRSEYTAPENVRLSIRPSLEDDHSFVNSIHNEAHYIGSRHAWQLLSNDVFQLN